MEIRNILVTGANGQLGNEMRLQANQHSEYSFLFTDVAELDITDEKAIDVFVQDNNIDCIVNCAAFTAVDKAGQVIKEKSAIGCIRYSLESSGRLRLGNSGVKINDGDVLGYQPAAKLADLWCEIPKSGFA